MSDLHPIIDARQRFVVFGDLNKLQFRGYVADWDKRKQRWDLSGGMDSMEIHYGIENNVGEKPMFLVTGRVVETPIGSADPKIVDKIKKLLSLGDPTRNADENEQRSALRRARELIKEHGVSREFLEKETPQPWWTSVFGFEYEDTYENRGYEYLVDIDVIKPLTFSDIYHPTAYDEDAIDYYEEPPEMPIPSAVAMFKPAGEPPSYIELGIKTDWELREKPYQGLQPTASLDSSLREIQNLVGGDYTSFSISSSLRMLTRQEDYPGQSEAENWPVNFIMGHEVIRGNAIFVREGFAEKPDFSQVPWPWQKTLEQDFEELGMVYQSITSGEARLLENTLAKWVGSLRRIEGVQPPLLLGATHFTMLNKEVGSEGADIFTTDVCEKCGGVGQDANGMKVNATRAELLFLGLTELDILPPEMGYSEELEGVICENCH